jgi:hypothetical protein
MPTADALPLSTLATVGEHFWLQLTGCRHCGAFEAAADAFHRVCRQLWRWSSSESLLGPAVLSLSPRRWLQQVVEALTNTSPGKRKVIVD